MPMVQVIDRWGTVVGTKGMAIPNLFLRGKSLYWRQTILRKQIWQRIPLRRLRAGEELSRDHAKQALEWMKKAEQLALDSMTRFEDAREGLNFRSTLSSLEDVLAAYRAACARLGRPSARTVENNCWALLRIVAVGLDSSPEAAAKMPASVLSGDLVARYADKELESGDTPSRRRSIESLLTQARSVFRRDLLAAEYDGLTLPPLEKFLKRRGVEAPEIDVRPFSQAEIEALKSGANLKEKRADLYAAWMLGFHLALRGGEIAQARVSWLREIPVTDQMRQAGAWIGDRKTVWCLDLGTDPETQLKTAASAGIVPVADDVAAELMAASRGGEWFVPGESPTTRANLVKRDLSAWMRGEGITREKTTHLLRAYRQQVWSDRYGEEIRSSWARHTRRGVAKHYVPTVVWSKQPMGLAE